MNNSPASDKRNRHGPSPLYHSRVSHPRHSNTVSSGPPKPMECLNHLLQGLLFSKYQGHLLIVTSTLTLAIAMPFENVFFFFYEGLSRWLSGKESTCQCRRRRFDPWEGKILCRRKWQPTPVFLPGKSYRQTSWWAGVARVRHD